MTKSYFLLIFVIFCTHTAFAQIDSKIVSKKDFAIIENRVQQELKNPALDDNKKFVLCIKTARELFQYRFYDKSIQYYQQAIELKVSENKSEAFINLIAIALTTKDKNLVKQRYLNAVKYFENNNSFKTNEIAYYLKSIENYLPGKSDNSSELVEGFYGMFAHEENLINLLKNKDYHKAFELLSPTSLSESTNDFNIIVYDSLNVFINHKKIKKLFCDKQYQKYPNSFSYSTLICGLLNDYLQFGKFSDKKIKMADIYFNQENKDKKYLYDIVREIK